MCKIVMKNFSKIKNDLKTTTKKLELKNSQYFCITHAKQITVPTTTVANITKLQYLATDFAKIINKSQIKFPIEIHTYNSRIELLNSLASQKKNLFGFIHINSNLFVNKNLLKTYNFQIPTLYTKLYTAPLKLIRLTGILKHLLKNKTNK